MAWRTKITQEYGIDFPFVSAGMGFIALPPLASAVSNAGGLGLLGVAPAPAEGARAMIQATKQMTSKPFGVDLVIAETMFGPSTTDEHIDACIAEDVKVVVFFWNLPKQSWVEKLNSAGAKVWIQVGTVERAQEAVRLGADAIIAQGQEAGGHNHSNLALTSLVPAIVDAVAPVPVIAAGGIADGRTAAAAFALGADAICVGTRLIASDEAYAHQEYKNRVIAASASSTAKTSIFGPEWPDQPMRVLRNRVVSEWIGRDNQTPSVPADPIGRTLLGGQEYPMPKFSAALPTPDTSGDFEEMCLPAGESAELVREIKPAATIMQEMMSEATQAIERLRSNVAN
jgi:NAD(P)H-dependent flavin oxidoreductase YrpB (nitropropane dioxygenase family)